MLRNTLAASVAAFCLLQTNLYAAPLATMKVSMYEQDGLYYYSMTLMNNGPILESVTTPASHAVTNYQEDPPRSYSAGDKYLTDDENVVYFGLDLGSDDVEVISVDDVGKFHGDIHAGWRDSDGDGVPNKVLAWHLPFYGWTLDDTLKRDEKFKAVHFVLNQPLKEVNFWVGGSDDAVIWIDDHAMVEDEFGIYDATMGEYLAVISERLTKVKQRHAPEHDDD